MDIVQYLKNLSIAEWIIVSIIVVGTIVFIWKIIPMLWRKILAKKENLNRGETMSKERIYEMLKVLCFIILFFEATLTIFLLFNGHFLFSIFSFLVWIFSFASFLKKIPYNPPHIGIVVVLGTRLPIVISEGWHLLFLLIAKFEMVNVEKRNITWTFSDIRCKARETKKSRKKTTKEVPLSGGEISVEVFITWRPDYKSSRAGLRLISFLNSGRYEKVEEIMKGLIEEDVREMAKDYSWEDFTFSTGNLRSRLVRKLTGEDLNEEGIEENLHKNGLPDVVDLGVSITRFAVGKIKEQGELARAASKLAIEQQERQGEDLELVFVGEHIKKLTKLGLDPDVAVDVIQTERGKSTKHIAQFRGLEGSGGGAISALVGGYLSGGKSSPLKTSEDTDKEKEEERKNKIRRAVKEIEDREATGEEVKGVV